MKKTSIIFIGIIAGLAIISSWIIFSNKGAEPALKEIELEQEQEEIGKEVVLVIDYSQGEQENFKVEFIEGMTAFDLLETKTKEMGLSLKIKTYDFGIMIESIGDKENGTGGKYWLYYVDGEMPMVSADKQDLKAGDKVEFKFEESPF